MKSERQWRIEVGKSVKQEADRMGLTQVSWQIVKLLPSAGIGDFEKIEVSGTVSCHQCGKPISFTKTFTWGMLAQTTLTCTDCNVDIMFGAYDTESAGAKPLWVYAAPSTESAFPSHRNDITIKTIDGFVAPADGSPERKDDSPAHVAVEADSLKAARDLARARTPRKQFTLGETIVRNPTTGAVEGDGMTEAEARDRARAQIPRDAIQTGETLITQAGLQTKTLSARTEDIARANAKVYGRIESIRLSKPERRGILGFGRRLLNEYEITLNCQARMRLTYKTTASLDVTIGTLPQHAHCQVCGKEGFLQQAGSELAFYACVSCTETYCAAIQKLTDALLGPLAALDRSGSIEERQFMKRIDAEYQAQLGAVPALKAFRCWQCGSAIPLALEAICPSCGMYQNALLRSGAGKQ